MMNGIKYSLFKTIIMLYMLIVANNFSCYSQDSSYIKQVKEELDQIYREMYHTLDEFIIDTVDKKEIFTWKRFRTKVNGTVRFSCTEDVDAGTRWDFQGQIRFKDGLKHGLAKIMNCETGTRYDLNYKMGFLDGYCKVYLDTSKFINGKNENIYVIFYETNFIKGSGIWKDYYSNGNLKETGEYKSGRKEGEWLYYSRDNHLYLKRYFEKGIQIDSVKIKIPQTEILEIMPNY